MPSPTSRSLRWLRDQGWLPEIVERFLHVPGIRRDCFGCFDILAVRTNPNAVLLVQVTSRANVGARVKKIRRSPLVPTILKAGVVAEVHGWSRIDGRWTLKRIEIRGDELTPVEITPKAKRRKVERTLFDGM
jgi:hypothetical protein